MGADHPLIRKLETYSAPAGEGVVGFVWIERYASDAEMAADHYTDECKALWEPVRTLARAGTFGGGAWTAGPGLRREG